MMWKMRWITVVKGICYVLVSLFILKQLEHVMRPVNTDVQISAIHAFHEQEKDSFDVIVYGSSHPWNGVNSVYIQEKYGIRTYNYSNDWQKLNTTELFFYDSLDTQRPKVVLIEMFNVGTILKDQELDGEIYYTRALDFSKAKCRYLRQCFGQNINGYLSYFFPLYSFHSNWMEISQASHFVFQHAEEMFAQNQGWLANETVNSDIKLPVKGQICQQELSNEAVETLDGIIEKCTEEDIEVVLFTLPSEAPFAYSDALIRYAESKNVAYLDLYLDYSDIGIDEKTDFYDKGHMNRSGAEKVSEYLGSYLVDHFDF